MAGRITVKSILEKHELDIRDMKNKLDMLFSEDREEMDGSSNELNTPQMMMLKKDILNVFNIQIKRKTNFMDTKLKQMEGMIEKKMEQIENQMNSFKQVISHFMHIQNSYKKYEEKFNNLFELNGLLTKDLLIFKHQIQEQNKIRLEIHEDATTETDVQHDTESTPENETKEVEKREEESTQEESD